MFGCVIPLIADYIPTGGNSQNQNGLRFFQCFSPCSPNVIRALDVQRLARSREVDDLEVDASERDFVG